MRRGSLLLLALFSISLLYAQGTGGGNLGADDGIFPITLVLEGADYAVSKDGVLRAVWRPDWPPQIPVDAFRVLSGEISRATIEGEGISLNLTFDPQGRLEEFPFMLNGRMAQVNLVYNGFAEKKEMFITFPSWDGYYSSDEEPWKLEFLEYRGSSPYLVRASRLDVWYFVYFSGTMDEILETWYDVTGNFVDAFAFSLIEIDNEKRVGVMRDYRDPGSTDFFYDSRGLLTESVGPLGVYKVLYYREDLPRYWERRPAGETDSSEGEFAFQWDGTGFIPRATGESGDGQFDYRYEYSVDERGNWIERRVIQMVYQPGILQPGLLQSGLLAPSPGLTYRRILEYRE
jgi:hypothetical protein